MSEEPEYAVMRVLTTDGQLAIPLEVGSEDASLIGGHWNAIKLFRDTGKGELLKQFQGLVVGGEITDKGRVGGHVLETDRKKIKAWAKSGDLDLDDPYAETDGDA